MMTYRAAYIGDAVLTGPEHAHLSDAELIAEAQREMDRQDPGHAIDADGRPLRPTGEIHIGDWTGR